MQKLGKYLSQIRCKNPPQNNNQWCETMYKNDSKKKFYIMTKEDLFQVYNVDSIIKIN